MSNKAFDKVAKGLREALSIARGDTKPARLHIPAEIDVRYIRNKLRFLKMILRQRSVLRSIISRLAWRGANLFDAYRARTGHRNCHASAAARGAQGGIEATALRPGRN
jgi:hypothetical protein